MCLWVCEKCRGSRGYFNFRASTNTIFHFVDSMVMNSHRLLLYALILSVPETSVGFFLGVVMNNITIFTCSTKYAETIDKRWYGTATLQRVQSLNPIKPLCSMINSSLFAESHDTDHRMHIIDFLILSRFVCSSI